MRRISLGAAVLAGALALTGCATAAATTSAVTSAAARGHAEIIVYSINGDGPDFRAIVTGAVGDHGPAVTVGPTRSEMRLSLTRGSFRLSTADLDKKLVMATSHEPICPRTCSDFASVRAAVPIVSGSGP